MRHKIFPVFMAAWICVIAIPLCFGDVYPAELDTNLLADVDEVSYMIWNKGTVDVSELLLGKKEQYTELEEAVGKGVRKSFSRYPWVKIISSTQRSKSKTKYSPTHLDILFILSAREDYFDNKPVKVASLSVRFTRILPAGKAEQVRVTSEKVYPFIVPNEREKFLDATEQGVTFLSNYVSNWMCQANMERMKDCK